VTPPTRSIGYRVLGRAFDYLLHLRPAAWPILALHVLTGSALALGIEALFAPARRGTVVLGTLVFVVGLEGGTLALNSAFDRDAGDVAGLRNPPVPPGGLAVFGFAMMLAALALASRFPAGFVAATALCVLLSVLYSVPPVRLKGVAGLDWLVNFLGFGLLTPYAGWGLTGQGLTRVGGIVLFSFALLFGGLYPLTQLYHLAADRNRGDRTLVVAIGITRAFGLAFAMTGFAFLGFAAATALQDPGFASAGRWIALLLAALAWSAALFPWWRDRMALDPAGHQRRMKRSFLAWAVTDLAILWVFAR
jgi:1,4-dihydroxy-2-naphthoate octaprenyltransferase